MAIKGKLHQRTIDRVNIIVRLELANPLKTQPEIAALAGLNGKFAMQRLSMLKRTPYYKIVHNRYLTGVINDLDLKVKENLNSTQETLKFAVPIAMHKLLQQALQEKDLRIQNKACNDLLDRDGHFAKVTRHGLATPEQGGIAEDKDNKAAQELIAAINKQPVLQPTPSIEDPPVTDTTQ